jgi:hypothetical protein
MAKKKKTTKVKKPVIKPADIHPCPQGQHWSESLNKCIDDIG